VLKLGECLHPLLNGCHQFQNLWPGLHKSNNWKVENEIANR
jgi:hypothetical protein